MIDERPAHAIRLDAVGKRYWKLEDRAMLLRSLLPFTRDKRSEFWAMRDLDLTIGRGETVGIVGRNGAGKTTLLRMLAGVTRPSVGHLEVVGRVAPLISVGVGFHPEMSGRENVFVNGMLLGLTEAELERRFDEIVDFAEMHEFIDTPVKFYSSGMFMRLGFSVAVHCDPDVLLVDEVLAVGDLAFQLKCFERMREIQRAGTTIVIVSHSMHAIRLLCPRALVIRRGKLEYDGDVEGAIARHHELLSLDAADDRTLRFTGGSVVVGGASVVERQLLDEGGLPVDAPRPGGRVRLVNRIRFDREVVDPHAFFSVTTQDGTLAYAMRTALGQPHRTYRAGEVATVDVEFDAHLAGGSYRLCTVITSSDGREVFEPDGNGLLLYVTPPLGSSGIADLDAVIRMDGVVLTDHPDVVLGDGRAMLGS